MQTLTFFAAFRDQFGESLVLNQQVSSIAELKNVLVGLQPESAALLGSARFAVNHTLIKDDHFFDGHEHIYIIPPSGGG